MAKVNKIKKQDNILVKMWNKITIEKWQKALRVIIICMAFMVISEAIFEIPAIADFFGQNLIQGKSGWVVYAIVWLVMFAQVAIIPIPALPILVACNQIDGLVASNNYVNGLFSIETVGFLALVVSATVTGAIAAYWLGRTVGKPAIKWIAGSEQDYKIWSKKLNSKTGKWLYASTVLLPIFPDDLISLVVGSIKMNFSFYVITNIICKTIGLFTMLLFMRIPPFNEVFGKTTREFPLALVLYIIILVGCYIIQAILNARINRNQPKSVKMEVIKESIIKKLIKNKSTYKDLIIDYKLDRRWKTFLASKIKIHKYYTVNEQKEKQKIRIIIECRASNYNEIVFDKTYKLTEKYTTLIKDVKECNF